MGARQTLGALPNSVKSADFRALRDATSVFHPEGAF
jgi:hypothetical protein